MATIPENYESASVQGTEHTVFDLAGLLIAEQTQNLEFTFALKNEDPTGMPAQHTVSETREFSVSPVVVEEPPPAQ